MKKGSLIAVLAFVVAFSFMAYPAFTDGHGQGQGKKLGHRKGFEEMVLLKAHMVLKNKDEIGLTDEQFDKIKALKVETKKNLIKQNADIEVVDVDIQAAMWNEDIDVEAVNKLVDQKYELKKAKAKMLVKTAAEFKGILTEEQKEKCKELHKERKEAFMKGKKGCGGETCHKGKSQE